MWIHTPTRDDLRKLAVHALAQHVGWLRADDIDHLQFPAGKDRGASAFVLYLLVPLLVGRLYTQFLGLYIVSTVVSAFPHAPPGWNRFAHNSGKRFLRIQPLDSEDLSPLKSQEKGADPARLFQNKLTPLLDALARFVVIVSWLLYP